MIAFIFSRLIGHTFFSILFAVIFGSIIGLVIGAIRRRIQDTIYVSIVGSFLGSILVCITPPITTPGSLESWGGGGGLGSLVVLMTTIFIAFGGIVSSFITSTFAFRWFIKLKTKWFLWIIGGLYMMMVISLIYNHLMYCSSSIPSSFCYTK
ncbi:hypothetical protein NIES2111_02780 [Nostoc sp. NIES-2111]|nr:hypothetical protein NIES2111_02780 [Nostoc sp. NIES-2111]